jgi:uncharacterized membrane protein
MHVCVSVRVCAYATLLITFAKRAEETAPYLHMHVCVSVRVCAYATLLITFAKRAEETRQLHTSQVCRVQPPHHDVSPCLE